MPVIINDDKQGALAAFKAYSPKFFNSALTGSGKTIGILCQMLNPAALTYKPITTNEHIYCKKEHYTNGNTKVNKIPLNTLTARGWKNMAYMTMPPATFLAKMGEKDMPGPNNTTVKAEVYTNMVPHSIIMEETEMPASAGQTTNANGTQSNVKSKKVTVCYQVFVYAVTDAGKTEMPCIGYDNITALTRIRNQVGAVANSPWVFSQTKPNFGSFAFDCNPIDRYASIFKALESNGYKVDRQGVVDYLNTYSVYDAVVKRSEEWQTTINDTLEQLCRSVSQNLVPPNYVYQKFNSQGSLVMLTGNILEAVTTMEEQLEYLEAYNIPLDLYRTIYDTVKKNFPPTLAQEFYKHNLNLLLSDTLHNLHSKKPQLTPIVLPPNPVPPAMKNGKTYSPEQSRAISCTDPLVLVQSGAGTGKSSVILGRVDWMIANGINPRDIMIISFTNAAADHIMTLNPYIQSMTIAKMIHTIYNLNFPGHELSTAETLSNTLDIYFPNDPLANQFRKRVQEMENKRNNDQANAYTQMNNFVERHLQDIIRLLDGVKQTTLALEIIICYQMINQLKEPPEIASKYLIIDEVQDNSVFEFIYALKYCDKHNEALFIVGKD